MKMSVVISLRGAQLRNGTSRGKNKKRTSSAVCSDLFGVHTVSDTVGTGALYQRSVPGHCTIEQSGRRLQADHLPPSSTAEINNKKLYSSLHRKLSWRLHGKIHNYFNVVKRPRTFLRGMSGYGLQSWGLIRSNDRVCSFCQHIYTASVEKLLSGTQLYSHRRWENVGAICGQLSGRKSFQHCCENERTCCGALETDVARAGVSTLWSHSTVDC